MNIKRILSLLLCLCILAGTVLVTVACSDTEGNENDTSKEDDGPVETGPLADLDYGGKDFRIYTSTNVAAISLGNSNPLIAGDPDADGSDTVASTVDERNRRVENLVGVNLVFTPVDIQWDLVGEELEKYIMANIDEYDLIINDLYALVELSFKNYFLNINPTTESYFDFSQNYWYEDYMKEVALHEEYQFILAGDFFIDIIRSAHCLIYNKTLYAQTFNAPGTELYDIVSDNEWTYEKWIQLISDAYVPTSGEDGTQNIETDTFGYIYSDMWGCMIPMLASAGVNYMVRDEEGWPTIGMDADRCSTVAETIYNIIHNANGGSASIAEDQTLNVFAAGRALFVGYQRLGSLENDTYLNIHDDAKAIIPYPMLKKEDGGYTTSSHDTAECGAIPVTVGSNPATFSFISGVTEALCQKTAELVMPVYYETSLKVKYASDENAAEMIDIIHDNFGNVFQLAYDYSLGDFEKGIFFTAIFNGHYNVASTLGKTVKAKNAELNRIISDFKTAIGE